MVAVPTAAQKRKQREADTQALAKRQALPVEQRRTEAEAREADARAVAQRVCQEVAAEEERERTAVRAEHKLLRAELDAWEVQNQRKLKPSDLRSDPELRVKYSRYRDLCDSLRGTPTNV